MPGMEVTGPSFVETREAVSQAGEERKTYSAMAVSKAGCMNERLFHIGNSRKRLMEVLSLLANFLIRETDDYELIIRPAKVSRSQQQNKRYWAILGEIAELEVDGRKYTAEVWHEYFKGKFIGLEEIALPSGKSLVRPISSTTLDVPAFADYMTQVEAWAAQRGLLVPEVA